MNCLCFESGSNVNIAMVKKSSVTVTYNTRGRTVTIQKFISQKHASVLTRLKEANRMLKEEIFNKQ